MGRTRKPIGFASHAGRLGAIGVIAALLALLWVAGGAFLALFVAIPIATAVGLYLLIFANRFRNLRSPGRRPPVETPPSLNGKLKADRMPFGDG